MFTSPPLATRLRSAWRAFTRPSQEPQLVDLLSALFSHPRRPPTRLALRLRVAALQSVGHFLAACATEIGEDIERIDRRNEQERIDQEADLADDLRSS